MHEDRSMTRMDLGTEDEELILVDEFDNQVGTATRSDCHAGRGLRHRAFVIFLFDSDDRVLLQLRSDDKLGGGCWDVSAASHVRNGESYESAIARCLRHELGLSRHGYLRRVLSYVYREPLGERAENEYCVLYTASLDAPVTPNPEEIDAIRFEEMRRVARDVTSNPEGYTRWLREAVDRFLREGSPAVPES